MFIAACMIQAKQFDQPFSYAETVQLSNRTQIANT